MTRKIITVTDEDSITEATQKMQNADVGSVVVQKNNKIIGIMTDRDVVLRSSALGASPDDMSCGQIMTADTITARSDMVIDDVADLMISNQIRRIPVTENEKVVGMISLADIAQARNQNEEASQVLKSVTRKTDGTNRVGVNHG